MAPQLLASFNEDRTLPDHTHPSPKSLVLWSELGQAAPVPDKGKGPQEAPFSVHFAQRAQPMLLQLCFGGQGEARVPMRS